MNEIVIKRKKNGLWVLILTVLLYAAAIAGLIFGGIKMDAGGSPILFIVCLAYACVGWIVLPGLKILKPQEALVLTLFGKYVGTLKGNGFYFVGVYFNVKTCERGSCFVVRNCKGRLRDYLAQELLGERKMSFRRKFGNFREVAARQIVKLEFGTAGGNRDNIIFACFKRDLRGHEFYDGSKLCSVYYEASGFRNGCAYLDLYTFFNIVCANLAAIRANRIYIYTLYNACHLFRDTAERARDGEKQRFFFKCSFHFFPFRFYVFQKKSFFF